MLRLGDLADPAVAAELRAQLEEQARPAPCLADYAEFLALSVLEERTPEQQARFDELAAIYNPPASAEEIDEAQAQRDDGKDVGLGKSIMLDAAYRATIPRNRTDRRFQRRAPKLSARVLLRPMLVAAGRFRDRGDSSRPRGRRATGSARARVPGRPSGQDDDPSPSELTALPSARVLYAHAAAFRGDRRVAEWLEYLADEAVEGVDRVSAMLREALVDIDRGLALLPVGADKRPAAHLIRRTRGRPGWLQLVNEPATASEVHAWLEDDPTTGIGVLCGEVSGVAVFDVDVPALAPPIPTTATVATRRGFHAYARIDGPVRTREHPWGSVRGEGAYVVAPCTRRADGGTYAWELTPEDAGFADFTAFDSGATAPYIRSSCNRRSTCPSVSAETLGPLAELERNERVALRLGRALGLPDGVEIGESFPCLLHADKSPSAALWRYQPGANVLYHDFHGGKHGSPPWMPLARTRAWIAGRTDPLNAPELVVWKLRLAHEAGLLEPLAFERPAAPDRRLEDVWQGFLDLVALRWTVERGNPTTFSVRFAAAWCGVSKRQAHESIGALVRAGSLRLVGRDPRGTRLWLPEGVVPID